MFIFQAAVYGLGVCAEFGGSVFKSLVGGNFVCVLKELIFYSSGSKSIDFFCTCK